MLLTAEIQLPQGGGGIRFEVSGEEAEDEEEVKYRLFYIFIAGGH